MFEKELAVFKYAAAVVFDALLEAASDIQLYIEDIENKKDAAE